MSRKEFPPYPFPEMDSKECIDSMKEEARKLRASQVQNQVDSETSSDKFSHQLFPEPRRVSGGGKDNVAKQAVKVLGSFNKFQPYVKATATDHLLGVPTQPNTPVPNKSVDGKSFPYPKSGSSHSSASQASSQNDSTSTAKSSNIHKSAEKISLSSYKDRHKHDTSSQEKRKDSPEKRVKPQQDASARRSIEKDMHEKHRRHDRTGKEKSERKSHEKSDKVHHEKRDKSHNENVKSGHERTSSGGSDRTERTVHDKVDRHDRDDQKRSSKSSHDKSEISKHDKKGHRRSSSSSSSHISHVHQSSSQVSKTSAEASAHTNSNSAKTSDSLTSPSASTVLKPRHADKTNRMISPPVLEDIVNLKTQPTDSENDDYSRVQQGLRTPPNGVVNGFRKPDLNLIMPKEHRPSTSGLHDILREMIIEPPLTGIHTPKKEEKFPFSSHSDVHSSTCDTTSKEKVEDSRSAKHSKSDQSLDLSLSGDSETEQTPNTSKMKRDAKPKTVPSRAGMAAVKVSRAQEMTSTEGSSSESSESGPDSDTSSSDDEAEDDEENKERDKEKVPPDIFSPDTSAPSPKQENSSWSLQSLINKLNSGTSPLSSSALAKQLCGSTDKDDNFHVDPLGFESSFADFDEIHLAIEKRSDDSVINSKVISPDLINAKHSPGATSTTSNESYVSVRSPDVHAILADKIVPKRTSSTLQKTDTTPSRVNKTSSSKNRTPSSKTKPISVTTPKNIEKPKCTKNNSLSDSGTPKSKTSKAKEKSKKFISDSSDGDSSIEIDVVSVSTEKNGAFHSPIYGDRDEVSKQLDFTNSSVKKDQQPSKSPTQVPKIEIKTSHSKSKEKKSKEKSHTRSKTSKKDSLSVIGGHNVKAEAVVSSPAREFITDPLLSPIPNFPEKVAIDVPRNVVVPHLNDGRPSIVVHIDLVLLNRVPKIDKTPSKRTLLSPSSNSSPPPSNLSQQKDFVSPDNRETSPIKSKSSEVEHSSDNDIDAKNNCVDAKNSPALSEPKTDEVLDSKNCDVAFVNTSKLKISEKLDKTAKDDSPSKCEHTSPSKHVNDKMLTSSSGGCAHDKSAHNTSAPNCDFQKNSDKSPVSETPNPPDKPPPEKFVKRKAESDKITLDVSKRHKLEINDEITVDASDIKKSDKIVSKPSTEDSSSEKVKSSHDEGTSKESSKKRHHHSEHRRSSSSSSSSRHCHKTSSKKPKVDEKESDSKIQPPSSSKVSEETNGISQPNGQKSCTTPVREQTNGVQSQNGQNHVCNSHPHQMNHVAGPLTNGVAESDPELNYSNHFPLLSSFYHPVKPEKLDSKKLFDKGKEFKNKGQKEKDIFRKNVAFVEAALRFILCGYAQEKDSCKPNENSGPFNMYKDSITFVSHSSRLKTTQSNDPDAVARERKLAVLCMRIHSLLLYKLYRLKKAEAERLKRSLDDHNNKTSSTKPPAHAPSPHQVNWNNRSTGTPSPMSPTPSPSGSVCSVGSAGSCEVPTPKMTNGNIGSTMSSPVSVSVPQRIHLVTQQYLLILHYLTQSEDYREQADNLQREYRDFFYPLDRDHGPITLSSSMPNLVKYVQEGLKRLTDNT